MPASNQVSLIPFGEITISENRQRKEIKNIEELAESISRLGLLNPIVVTRDNVLVAGERRLTAWKLLDERESCLGGTKFNKIPVHFVDELDDTELLIIELDENIKRSDITWQEQALAIRQIHNILVAASPLWTISATAERLGLHSTGVSRYLQITKEAPNNPKLLEAPTISSAVQILLRSEERKKANIMNAVTDMATLGLASLDLGLGEPEEQSELQLGEIIPADPNFLTKPAREVKIKSAEDSILNTDAIEFMAAYRGERFNFIHCDFPYGINFQDGWDGNTEQWGGYDDSPEVYWKLLKALASSWDNIAAPSCHFMFWFSMKYYGETLSFFEKNIPQLSIDPFPFIWLKSDNKGSLPDPNRGPRRIYETCLFGHAGDRKIIKAVSNAYAAPTQKSQAAHISEKPEPVLRHFMQMLVDENTTLLDPTCGGGSALRAAESLKARKVLGLELNQEYCNAAKKRLTDMRNMEGIKL